MPVAILGTEDFDVRDIDPATVNLMGVPPLRWSYEDVSAPPEITIECGCLADSVDGYEDLTLKFSRAAIIATLGEVQPGEERTLTITGLIDEQVEFDARDCVVIRPNGDVNNDGTTDISDLTGLVGYVFGNQDPVGPIDAMDINLSGEVDISDVVEMVSLLFL